MKIKLNGDKDIPGLQIRAFGLNELNISCRVIMTYSDAIELTNKTKSGLYKNKKFVEMFINQLFKELRTVCIEAEKVQE